MDIDLVECFLCSKSCLCCLYLFAVCSLVCCNTSPTRLCYYSSFFLVQDPPVSAAVLQGPQMHPCHQRRRLDRRRRRRRRRHLLRHHPLRPLLPLGRCCCCCRCCCCSYCWRYHCCSCCRCCCRSSCRRCCCCCCCCSSAEAPAADRAADALPWPPPPSAPLTVLAASTSASATTARSPRAGHASGAPAMRALVHGPTLVHVPPLQRRHHLLLRVSGRPKPHLCRHCHCRHRRHPRHCTPDSWAPPAGVAPPETDAVSTLSPAARCCLLLRLIAADAVPSTPRETRRLRS